MFLHNKIHIKKLIIFLFFLILYFGNSKQIRAFEITSDPQYVVINFSDTFHFLDWYAPESKWQNEVKPIAIKRLKNIKSLLTTGATKDRQLAWSTLLEYTNYPPDTVSDTSPYVIRLKRIMELAEAEDFPVFIPLNGIQWWDEVPELWNWWDKDGNQTPGCTNDNYVNCGFAKLRNPAYRKRFIEGYNPENIWNVDWQDWTTPMKFVTRNWGNGDFLVAPSPNIVDHGHTKTSFEKFQKARYEKLIKTMAVVLDKWEHENKQYLFAGLSIGTEVTLNGAILPGDAEFKPYGYRAIQDIFCPSTDPDCGAEKSWTRFELHSMRQEIMFRYFNELALIAYRNAIPKQRVYSHVWSEAEPDELKYTNAIGASITYFSRPGMSIYGKALDPLGFSLLANTLQANGYPAWAAPEFAPLTRDASNWNTALTNTLDNPTAPAKLIDIYNETDILNTPAIPQLHAILTEAPEKQECLVSETIPITPNYVSNPPNLSWKFLNQNDQAKQLSIVFWNKNRFPQKANKDLKEIAFDSTNITSYILDTKFERGFYFWAVKRSGCNGEKWSLSTPHLFYNFPPLPEVKLPKWVTIIKAMFRL